jgi:hypothetical protein
MVRRAKAPILNGCNSHPTSWSLQSVVAGAVVEVTKWIRGTPCPCPPGGGYADGGRGRCRDMPLCAAPCRPLERKWWGFLRFEFIFELEGRGSTRSASQSTPRQQSTRSWRLAQIQGSIQRAPRSRSTKGFFGASENQPAVSNAKDTSHEQLEEAHGGNI